METDFFFFGYFVIYQDNSHYPNTILAISHIAFPSLQKIYLYNNNIESIEMLSRMWMPAMNRLIFGIYSFIQPITV